MRCSDIPQLMASGVVYECDVGWQYLEHWLTSQEGATLCPDFQRGHVWIEQQQIDFVEFSLKGGTSGRNIYWNSPTWTTKASSDLVLVDGLQRITAVRRFMGGEIPAFGFLIHEFEGSFPSFQYRFHFHVNELQTRVQVLNWYLEINAAGTPHTEEELERVRDLIRAEGEVPQH